jgi:hypothetical protein
MSAGGISPAKVGWNRDRHRPDMGDGDFFIFGGLLCQKMEMFPTQSRNFIANGIRPLMSWLKQWYPVSQM